MRKNRTVSKIIKLKENKKMEAEIEVKEASERADEEGSKLQSLEQDYEDTLKYFNEKQEAGSMDVYSLVSCYDFFSRINGKINDQKKVHNQRLNELDCLKNNLITVHKEKKVFEILHDKTARREQKEKQDGEQKENDFFALSRRLR